ncbi:hypothetical protein D9611_010172 [Ephemerocybe angulata]|uniref:Protein kinase domain-containing protein n=1 Tax=Ephemerocybe angulata TaxID=980116 RepID=A0A8H5EVI0_9AGAR|nr:hypothetical protein D9611_010172 [Tulosesus angulatus]
MTSNDAAHSQRSPSMASSGSSQYSDYSTTSSTDSYDVSSAETHGALKREISDLCHTRVDLSKFVEVVWGLDRPTTELILKLPLPLEASNDICGYKSIESDSQRRGPFIALTKKLLAAVQGSALCVDTPCDAPGSTAVVWYAECNSSVTGTTRKGDSLTMMTTWPSAAPDLESPTLAVAKHIMAMARPRIEMISASSGTQCHGTDLAAASALPQAQVSNGSKLAQTLKRSREETQCDGPGRQSKRQRLEEELDPIGSSLLQLASLARGCLASTSRLWVTGLVIDDCKITATYFDRNVVACAAPFHFDEEPAKLALVIYAMSMCSRSAAGFDPHLRSWASHTTGSVTTAMERDLERPVDDVVGSFFEFPSAIDEMQEPSSVLSPTQCFRVTGWIHKPHELIGRSTMVYKIQRLSEDNTVSKEDFVLKLSWPPESRTSEINVLRELKKKVPERLHAHLPNVEFATTFTAEQLSLPWLKLGLELSPENNEARVLRVLASSYYDKLWEAGSIEVFKQAWLDCVECHHEAWKRGGVLHRDLSDSNIMISRRGGDPKGLLNDWDMASFIEAIADKTSSAHNHNRTGTLPFMALDLIYPTTWHTVHPREHWYRHDLESFFYILVWAAIHYNLKEKTRDEEVHPSLVPWTSGDANTHAMAKYSFLRPDDRAALAYRDIKPGFEDVLKDWIRPLRKLIKASRESYGVALESETPSDVFDYSTCGGVLTFETFMAALKQTPRVWDDEVALP